LAKMMLALQSRGCHNINLVTPTHVTPQIVEALEIAAQGGLRLPVVYNCGGYEEVETLRALAGTVDIYMPDFKFGGEAEAEKYCRAPRYPAVARSAIAEMHRQVGDLVLDPEGIATQGIATRGLLVRHLLLPGGLAGSEEVFDFLAREISPDTYLNLMDQYRPVPAAAGFPELNRRITEEEYAAALGEARGRGLWKGLPTV
ncbi:MAG: radical SAM protein, partial [Candidatus Aureabacteria bacterium]|nr:radical SAM protein [Candidatus Auribacterota bacterium]